MLFATITIDVDVMMEVFIVAFIVWAALYLFVEVFAVILMFAGAFLIVGAIALGTISYEITGWPQVHFIQYEKYRAAQHPHREPYYR